MLLQCRSNSERTSNYPKSGFCTFSATENDLAGRKKRPVAHGPYVVQACCNSDMLVDIKMVIGSNIISKSQQVSSSSSCMSVNASNIQKYSCLTLFSIHLLNKSNLLLQWSNVGCLVDHTIPAWALLDIRNNAITRIFRDEQNRLLLLPQNWYGRGHEADHCGQRGPPRFAFCKEAIFRLVIFSFKTQ